MKLETSVPVFYGIESRPAWGAWIETASYCRRSLRRLSRPAWGAWIETPRRAHGGRYPCSRAPHGARGLKLLHRLHHRHRLQSRPARGAWIETEKLGGELSSQVQLFLIGCFFHLGLKKTTALCQNWVREWQCREECSNGKLGAVRGNRGISYGKLTGGRCLHEFGREGSY